MKFYKKGSLRTFQKFTEAVYGLPDDRLFSLSDLLSNQERFTMRALKGIRQGDQKKLKINLCIALSWLMSVANRLHVDVEELLWRRFPYHCSYCGKKPCRCKKIKPKRRVHVIEKNTRRPKTIGGLQKMFSLIYPPGTRTLSDAGIHLAEEMGELSESVHQFLGEHKTKQFESLEHEIADYASCIFGVANSAGIDIEKELERLFHKNCHVCHSLPCSCGFSFIAQYVS